MREQKLYLEDCNIVNTKNFKILKHNSPVNVRKMANSNMMSARPNSCIEN
jgi:hypothetical protein